jgi:DNA-binding NtrC family response regulator
MRPLASTARYPMADVLLLADDQMVGRMLRDFVEDEGHQVIAVEEGEHALIQLRATLHPVVAILFDVPLGPTLAELLTTLHAERQELAPHAYIAVITTSRSLNLAEDIPPVMRDLEVAVFATPFDVYKLLAEVQRLTERFPEQWR